VLGARLCRTVCNGNILQALNLYLQQLHRGVGFSVGIVIISQLGEQLFVF